MPLMYGAAATERLAGQLDARTLTGTAASIAERWERDQRLAAALDAPAATTMVVLRGYVLIDDAGRPSLACSDLAFDESTPPVATGGLLPIASLIEPLVSRAPAEFDGHRVVVLDVEPLLAAAAMPVAPAEVAAAIEALVARSRGPGADRLWVLATDASPAAGWNPATQMPLTAEALSLAIGDAADLDGDDQLRLDETWRVMQTRLVELSSPQRFAAAEGHVDAGRPRRGRCNRTGCGGFLGTA